MKNVFITFLFFAFYSMSAAQVKTAKIFGDHMVLQQHKLIPVWGWAAKNESITLNFNSVTVKTKADGNGKWLINLPEMKAGGPFQMTIHARKDSVVITDIMIGEVWVCSGQSNMEFLMKDALGFNEQQNKAAAIPVRQFFVTKKLSFIPEKDLDEGSWVKANAASLKDFTAVGYFFAKELAIKLNVTVGIISSSWGGSQAEGWISKDGMLSSDIFKNYAENMPQTWEDADKRKDEQLKQFSAFDSKKVLYEADELAKKDSSFFNAWFKGTAPASWDWMGKFNSFRGMGFMQKNVLINEEDATKKSYLRLGEKDGFTEVFINDKLVYAHPLINNPLIELPAGTWKTGMNNLLIHVSNQTEPAWYGPGITGGKHSLFIKFDNSIISLAEDNWRLMPDFKQPYHYDRMNNNRVGTTLFNAMIYPLIPYAIQGIIWYQGETNTGRSYEYRKTFPLLISDWRKQWNNEFSFLFVQLASYGSQKSSNEGSGWAELREAQTMALSLPKTGMAVTTDIGNPDDIHPKNKEDVGKRLAANALNNVYGLNIPFCGPVYQSVDFNLEKGVIHFDHTYSGLISKDKYGYLKGFEIAGADKKFYYAQARIEGDHVIVWSEEVKHPVAIRYGWSDAPVDANLFNREGFPASPFRTDNWKGISDENKFE